MSPWLFAHYVRGWGVWLALVPVVMLVECLLTYWPMQMM